VAFVEGGKAAGRELSQQVGVCEFIDCASDLRLALQLPLCIFQLLGDVPIVQFLLSHILIAASQGAEKLSVQSLVDL
jgi:hypothetical protein